MNEKPASKDTCPICRAAASERYRPFCSARCSDLDLGRWLKESYAIPSTERIPEPTEEDN